MKDGIKAAMAASLGCVLETMFFMSTEISEEGTPADFFRALKGRAFGGQIDFSGPSSGRFFILIPETALVAMEFPNGFPLRRSHGSWPRRVRSPISSSWTPATAAWPWPICKPPEKRHDFTGCRALRPPSPPDEAPAR